MHAGSPCGSRLITGLERPRYSSRCGRHGVHLVGAEWLISERERARTFDTWLRDFRRGSNGRLSIMILTTCNGSGVWNGLMESSDLRWSRAISPRRGHAGLQPMW